MSLAQDCPGCEIGVHSLHAPDHGIKAGLIGGTYCDCPGDCEQRREELAQRFAEQIQYLKGVPVDAAEWAVKRPDGEVFEIDEVEARSYVTAGNADGSGRYRLLRRPVVEWEDVTNDS